MHKLPVLPILHILRTAHSIAIPVQISYTRAKTSAAKAPSAKIHPHPTQEGRIVQ
jgi:hypothetical protein